VVLIKLSKHDQYVENLRKQLSGVYDSIDTNVRLYRGKKRVRVVAEIDLLAKQGNVYDIYEVKCSHRITKAKLQLRKIRKKLSPKYHIRDTFFYCGNSSLLLKSEGI